MINHFAKPRASIALISLLLVMVISLILVVGMAETSLSTSHQYANNTSDKNAYYGAESCLEEALIRLEADPSYVGSTLTIDGDTACTIVVSGAGPLTLAVSVTHLTYTQNFQGQLTLTSSGQANNAQLTHWAKI